MRYKIIFASVAWLFALSVSPRANAGERTTLRESAIAYGDSVHVSDLLPSGAPEKIRARANEVALGNSPLPGAHRTFERLQIENALRNAPDLQAALIVPDEVDVTRWSRPLSREQIRAALVGSERAGADSMMKEMNLDQIEMSAAVLVTEEAARVAVLQIERSSLGSEVHARLWVPSEPKVPAFWVTVRRQSEHRAAPEPTTAPVIEDMALRTDQPRTTYVDARVSVKSGESVELVAVAAGMRITSPAIALGMGGVGEQVRVRIPATGKIVMTTVVGPRMVQLKY